MDQSPKPRRGALATFFLLELLPQLAGRLRELAQTGSNLVFCR
jgi:hypothetical protein